MKVADACEYIPSGCRSIGYNRLIGLISPSLVRLCTDRIGLSGGFALLDFKLHKHCIKPRDNTHLNGDNPVGQSSPLVEIENVYFDFPNRNIYSGLNLNIPRGKVTVVLGPSGSGKSTMLNLIGRRLTIGAGDIRFDGQSVKKLSRKELYALRKRMGMLFQSSALLTDRTVFGNVAFPIYEHTDLSPELVRRLVLLKLEMVGLRGARDLSTSELSGGMMRRVALARAIALDPELIMYDEPLTGLDPISKGIIAKLIRELNDALDTTSIVVTHNVGEACNIADYMYLIGDGVVVGEGTPEQMLSSRDPMIHQFMSGLPDGPVAYHYPAPALEDELLAVSDS